MKRLVVVGLALLIMGTSQANTNLTGNVPSGKPTVIVTQRPTATPSVRVRVSIPKIQKPKLFVGNPHKIVSFADDYDDDIIEVDDIITSYRREDLQRIHNDQKSTDPDELSEHVRWRLFLARTAAMIRYHQIHG